MSEIIFALWFYLPAGAANMFPVFASKIRWLDKLDIPIDFGLTFRGKRIFGDHKTVRGFVVGYVFALITLLLQIFIYNNVSYIREISLIDYNEMNLLLFGFIFTLGALGGDAIESFFKRQLNIKPGKSWAPFDQMDWILGAVLLSIMVTDFPLNVYLWGIAWGLLLHPISTVIGWLFNLKDEPI